jgi:hypothetical protein
MLAGVVRAFLKTMPSHFKDLQVLLKALSSFFVDHLRRHFVIDTMRLFLSIPLTALLKLFGASTVFNRPVHLGGQRSALRLQ